MHSVQQKQTPGPNPMNRSNSAGQNMGGHYQQNQGQYQHQGQRQYQGNRTGGNFGPRGNNNQGMNMRGDHQQHQNNMQQRQNPNPMPASNPMPMANQAPMPMPQPSSAPGQNMGGQAPQMQIQFVPSNDPMAAELYSKTMPIYAAITEINPSYKQTVGSTIFEFVTKLVGPQFAPKITGMLIDLPIVEIQRYVTNFDLLAQRVQQAQGLLQQQANAAGQGN